MTDELLRQFDKEMFDLYKKTRTETGYNATVFFHMLDKMGGVKTAQILLAKKDPSDGYTKLWGLGKLALTVEAFIWDNKEYQELFTEEELKTVEKRLREYKYIQ